MVCDISATVADAKRDKTTKSARGLAGSLLKGLADHDLDLEATTFWWMAKAQQHSGGWTAGGEQIRGR